MQSHNQSRPPQHAVSLALSLTVAVLVLARAWVTDDAYITFRVVDNLIDLNGPVYNVGERVQVFTHPLWFLLLSIFGALRIDLYYAAIALGVTATGTTIYLLAKMLTPPIAIITTAILATSVAFLDFSTSGLEGSLTHLLLVGIVYAAFGRDDWNDHRRSLAIVTLGGLAVLNRLDLAVLVVPVVTLSIYRSPRALIGILPPAVWYIFATTYYGSPVPNSVYAKLGAYPLGEALRRGLTYLADFAQYEPLHALAAVGAAAMLGWGWLQQSKQDTGWFSPGFALGLGAVLYVGSIVFAGGGYMHGRLLLPALVTLIAVGAVYAQTLAVHVTLRTAAAATAALGAFLLFGSIDIDDNRISTAGITNERAHYSHLWLSRRAGENEAAISGGTDPTSIAVSLREYADLYGPITVRGTAIGQFGYFAGSSVTVLDVLGLADPFIARQAALPHQRPGHINRQVPFDYYRARGDVSLQPDWLTRLRAFDSTLREDALADAEAMVWSHPDLFEQYERIRTITTGPIFDSDRLENIVAFARPSGLTVDDESVAVLGRTTLHADYIPTFGSLDQLIGSSGQAAPEGGRWDDERWAVALNTSENSLTLDLGSVAELTAIDLQADANDVYVVLFSTDGSVFAEPWIAEVAPGGGLITRRSDPAFTRTARFVRVRAIGGDGAYSVSRLDVWTEAGRPARLPGQAVIDLDAVTAGDRRVTVGWLPPRDSGGRDISGYVLMAEPGGHRVELPAGTGVVGSIEGLENGQPYEVTVAAVTEIGEGPASEPVTLTPEPLVVASRGDVTVRANFAPRTGTFAALLVGSLEGASGVTFDDPTLAVQLPDSDSTITIDLGRIVDITRIAFLADNNDTYGITFSLDDSAYGQPVEFGTVSGAGLQLRETASGFSRRARYLHLRPLEGDNIFALSALDVFDDAGSVIR